MGGGLNRMYLTHFVRQTKVKVLKSESPAALKCHWYSLFKQLDLLVWTIIMKHPVR